MLKRWLCPLVLTSLLLSTLASAADCTDNSSAQVASCGENSGKSGALFHYGGQEYYLNDLTIQVRDRLHQLAVKYYQERALLMDSALWQVFVAQEAERQNKAQAQVAMGLIKLTQPTEQAINAFYEANKANIPAPYEQVKRQIAQYLIKQQMQKGRSKLIATIKNDRGYQLLIDKPQPPIATINTDGFPSKGSMLAAVEVVEFTDYQCPHCKTASKAIRRLEKRYGDKLRVVFMDFPINQSGISQKVAEGAVCADQQGEFWRYHNDAFDLQSSLSAKSPLDLATKLDLDTQRFTECMSGTEAVSKVAKSKTEALRLGLDSTPTFFVNGIKLNPQSNLEKELSEAIDKAIKEAG